MKKNDRGSIPECFRCDNLLAWLCSSWLRPVLFQIQFTCAQQQAKELFICFLSYIYEFWARYFSSDHPEIKPSAEPPTYG